MPVAQRQLSLCHRDSCVCGTETVVSVAQRQISLLHRDRLCLFYIEICGFYTRKLSKIIKSGMKQVQVPPFELILCQDVATASGNPLEYLPAPKTSKKTKKKSEKWVWALGPPGPPLGP